MATSASHLGLPPNVTIAGPGNQRVTPHQVNNHRHQGWNQNLTMGDHVQIETLKASPFAIVSTAKKTASAVIRQRRAY